MATLQHYRQPHSRNHLDLIDFNFANTTLNYATNAEGTGGTLSVTDGAHTANNPLLGQYNPAGFQTGPTRLPARLLVIIFWP